MQEVTTVYAGHAWLIGGRSIDPEHGSQLAEEQSHAWSAAFAGVERA
jgi:hypothetical protein